MGICAHLFTSYVIQASDFVHMIKQSQNPWNVFVFVFMDTSKSGKSFQITGPLEGVSIGH